MNGFEKRAQLLKQKIKKAVLDMLKTWEPRKIRIADIAAEAHVSQVTIYNYFGSKEALLRETIKDYIDGAVAGFEAFLNREPAPSFKEIVQYAVFHDKEAFRSFRPEIFKQLLIEDREMSDYMERITRDWAMPLFIRCIDEAKKRGEISSGVSTATLMTFFNMYMAQSSAFLDQAQQSGDPEAFVEELVYLLFYGIRGQGDGEQGI
ncbi:TetR/AcrR family transcriptional regulator [Cohnella lubricantis]|uniref:TetR/AcrR family transcriptional regulator n=1 Tax=Cohnella lubricantis TaxID=2163172 RepID=A0A841TKL1_9BACL|nr:TetR/AcrR family transcriptional regulator [Cohnella lubricantis]MBB6679487.1 TetR/AcrR family transcriptional regulator [Cohnella lubricantis]MBP2118753.1 AcrR family transcriptional regulator [Cohnella lubricantis]